MHRFAVGPMSAAYDMQEMGERGTGSLEHGDSSGEKFWVHTPEPFLKYYYATFPEKLAKTSDGAAGSAAATTTEQGQSEIVKPEKPARSMLYNFVELTGDKLVSAGRFTGQHEWFYRCAPVPLTVSLCPPTASLKDRERITEERPGSQVSSMIDTARSVLVEELESRFFVARPSNTRLVQCYMSKQRPIASYLPARMCTLAKTVYLSWIRRAAVIAGVAIRSSPPRKKAKVAGVFRAAPSSSDAVAESASEFDTVTDEMQRWKELAQDRIDPFIDDQGLINEFALIWRSIRNGFIAQIH
eukprot:5960184-Prymnesium_polylepis.1